MRTCSVCEREKPLEDFERDRRARGGRTRRCKRCSSRRTGAIARRRREQYTPQERIYVIAAGDSPYFKVGTAVIPELRMSQLQVGCPLELRLVGILPGGRSEEKALHRKLLAYRVRGEWYRRRDPQTDEELQEWLTIM